MKKNNKTLHFFSEQYYPADNSTSFYITRIIQACAKEWNGKIRVYCATPKPAKELLSSPNIHIKRYNDYGLSKDRVASRLLRFTILTLKYSVSALLHTKSNDKVFAVTNPAPILLPLALLKRIKNFQYILLVYDIFPEVLIPGGISKPDSIAYRFALKMFRWAYNTADTLIVIGRDMQKIVEKKINDPSKIVFIPNWADTERISQVLPMDNPILKRLGIEKHFVFSIAGNMGRTQGLDNVLEAISMSGLNQQTSFLFMGSGAKKNMIEHEREKRKLKNVYITGWIKKEEQNAMLNACNIAVVSLSKGMYGLSVPSKSYFNMAAYKPLLFIGDENTEIAQVIRENKTGWIVPPDNPEALAKVLEEVQNISQEKLQILGTNARKTAENLFSEKRILPQYVQVICGNE